MTHKGFFLQIATLVQYLGGHFEKETPQAQIQTKDFDFINGESLFYTSLHRHC